jgi:hypothetical protein
VSSRGDGARSLTHAVREFRVAAEAMARATNHPVFQNFPRGCCKLASLLLARFLFDRGFGKADYVWGDRATAPAETDSHGWLRLRGLLIDVTGDQFRDGPGPVFLGEESSWHESFRPHDPFPYDSVMQFSEGYAEMFADLYAAMLAELTARAAERGGDDVAPDVAKNIRRAATIRLGVGEVVFDVADHAGADLQLVNHAVAAIALVWEHHVGRPKEFRLEIGDALADGDAGVDANGVYVPEHHFIGLAIGPRSRCAATPKPGPVVHAIRVAAHEAMHAVQCERAGGPVHFQGATPGDPAYNDHPTEIEAHRESVAVLKGYFPEMRGSVPTGGREYPVPAESPYTDAWRRFAEGERMVRTLNGPTSAARRGRSGSDVLGSR